MTRDGVSPGRRGSSRLRTREDFPNWGDWISWLLYAKMTGSIERVDARIYANCDAEISHTLPKREGLAERDAAAILLVYLLQLRIYANGRLAD